MTPAGTTDYGVDYEDARYTPVANLRELIRLDFQSRFNCDPGQAWWIAQNDRTKEVMDLTQCVLDTGNLQGLRSQITQVGSSCPFVDSCAVLDLVRETSGGEEQLRALVEVDPVQGAVLRVTMSANGDTLTVTTEATT